MRQSSEIRDDIASKHIYINAMMNMKPPKSKITARSLENGQIWDLPAKKGVGFLMVFGCFFGGLPLIILTFTVYSYFFNAGGSEFHSIWGWLGLFAFLSIFILIGSLAFYFGMKMRYTSFQITTHGGAIEVLWKFLKKEQKDKLESGNVQGVGLYSHSKTNEKPNYGLLIKAREGKDIKIANSYKEKELRWLASELLVELAQQGGLPTETELEKTYFSSEDGSDINQFVTKGVTVSSLEGDQFIIEKRGSVIAKSMFIGGLFGMIFSSIFLFIGFGLDERDLIFGIAGSIFAIVSLIIFLLSLTKFRTSEKFTFKADTIVKEKLRGEIGIKKLVYKKSGYDKLKVATSGSSNGANRYSVKLQAAAGMKDLTLFHWVDQAVSDVVKLKVNAWLAPKATIAEKSTFSSGYGSAMVTEASQQNIVGKQTSQQHISPEEVPVYSSVTNLKDIKGGVWMLRAFLSIFLCIGLGMTIFGVRQFIMAKDSETWPSVNGIITSSKVSTHSSNDGATYGADVSYKFQLEGNHYTGDKVTFSEVTTSSRNRASKIVMRYPVGKEVSVFYDPKNPEDNVLEQGISRANWLLPGIGCLFFFVPFIILIVTERARRKEAKEAKLKATR